MARYMEISMYLAICLAARYMEIPMYLEVKHMARYIEIYMFLAAKTHCKVHGNFNVPCS